MVSELAILVFINQNYFLTKIALTITLKLLIIVIRKLFY